MCCGILCLRVSGTSRVALSTAPKVLKLAIIVKDVILEIIPGEPLHYILDKTLPRVVLLF